MELFFQPLITKDKMIIAAVIKFKNKNSIELDL